MTTSDFTKGLPIKYNGETYIIMDYQFVNPGKGSAFTRTKIKHAKTQKVMEVTFKSNEQIEGADVEYRKCQYLYNDGKDFTFMDNTTFDQISMPASNIGDMADYLMESGEITVVYIDSAPFTIQLPPKMDFKVIEAPPGEKGDTATGGTKHVTIETGARIAAPLFIREGDFIKVNTTTGEYVERVNK